MVAFPLPVQPLNLPNMPPLVKTIATFSIHLARVIGDQAGH